jgi:hypothetical protein
MSELLQTMRMARPVDAVDGEAADAGTSCSAQTDTRPGRPAGLRLRCVKRNMAAVAPRRPACGAQIPATGFASNAGDITCATTC